MARQTAALRNTEKRTRRQQNVTPIDCTKTRDYEKLLENIRALEAKKAKFENQIQKKLEPVKESLGIDKLEEKIYEVDEQIDVLFVEKERFEALIIQKLSVGHRIKNFVLRTISKRFSPKYKAICEEIFANRPDEFEAAKERHGSRKEQYILIFKDEEVTRQLIPINSIRTHQEAV